MKTYLVVALNDNCEVIVLSLLWSIIKFFENEDEVKFFLSLVWFKLCSDCNGASAPGGSVRGERANFTRLVLGCIEAKFCE